MRSDVHVELDHHKEPGHHMEPEARQTLVLFYTEVATVHRDVQQGYGPHMVQLQETLQGLPSATGAGVP